MTAEKLDLDELELVAKSSHTFGIAPGIALALIARVKEAEAERDEMRDRWTAAMKLCAETDERRAKAEAAHRASGQNAEQITDLTGRLASVEGERARLRVLLQKWRDHGNSVISDDELREVAGHEDSKWQPVAGHLLNLRASTDAALSTPAPAGGGWRPISEAPRDGTEILAWTPFGSDICWWTDREDDRSDTPGHNPGWWGFRGETQPGRTPEHGFDDVHCYPAMGQPTYWRPLPTPPEKED